jgi:uncharacterized protein (TIGR02147 family)
MQLAEESLVRDSKDLRDISTLTLSFPHKDIDELREIVKTFREKVMQWVSLKSESDTVYQLNIQLFPFCLPPELKEPI